MRVSPMERDGICPGLAYVCGNSGESRSREIGARAGQRETRRRRDRYVFVHITRTEICRYVDMVTTTDVFHPGRISPTERKIK